MLIQNMGHKPMTITVIGVCYFAFMDVFDLFCFVGLLLIGSGVALVSIPAALVITGGMLLLFGLSGARARGGGS